MWQLAGADSKYGDGRMQMIQLVCLISSKAKINCQCFSLTTGITEEA